MCENQNMYFQFRKKAAKYNDRLQSREGAAELLGITPRHLANYELDLTKIVPVDSVIMMADLYQAPELRALYCKHTCPLGAENNICTQAGSIESIAVKMACLSKSGTLDIISGKLLEIAKDGRVTGDEKDELEAMAAQLSGMELLIQEMKLKAEERE